MGTSAMGTGTWQQQPSANGCQVPVPWQGAANIQLFPEIFSFFSNFSQLNCLYFIGIMYLCTK